MELAAKLHFCLNIQEVIAKRHISEHNTESELATLFDFVFVLDIWMYVSKEQLLIS